MIQTFADNDSHFISPQGKKVIWYLWGLKGYVGSIFNNTLNQHLQNTSAFFFFFSKPLPSTFPIFSVPAGKPWPRCPEALVCLRKSPSQMLSRKGEDRSANLMTAAVQWFAHLCSAADKRGLCMLWGRFQTMPGDKQHPKGHCPHSSASHGWQQPLPRTCHGACPSWISSHFSSVTGWCKNFQYSFLLQNT